MAASAWPGMNLFGDPAKLMEAQAQLWTEGLDIWQRALGGKAAGRREAALDERADKDRRFAAPDGATIRCSTRSARPIC